MAIGWELRRRPTVRQPGRTEAAYLATLDVAKPGGAFDPAPALSLASMDRDGRIVVNLLGPALVPTTTYQTRVVPNSSDKTSGPKTYVVPVTTVQRTNVVTQRILAADRVKVLTVDGKRVNTEAVQAALRGRSVPVVVTTDSRGLDRRFREALKPETLVLVVPAEKTDDPMPPPTVPPEAPALPATTPRVPPAVEREQ